MQAESAMLPSRLLRINSRYRSAGTSSDFVYTLDNRLVDNISGIALISASIPRLFGNVYSPINVLTYTINNVRFDFVVPNGQYTATQLAAILTTSPDFDCRYNTESQRFEFSYGEGPGVIIIRAISSIGRYIGLSDDLFLPELLVFVPVQNVPQLAGPNRVYLQSQFISGVNCVDTEQGASQFIPLMQPIDCSAVPFGFNINYDVKLIESSLVSYRDTYDGQMNSLRSIDLQLTDVFGNLLDMPSTVDSDFVFRMYTQPG
jgi:hypothetical protein